MFVAATLIGIQAARPQIAVSVADPDAIRFLSGFFPLEQNERDTYRWSTAQAMIHLFGFEAARPVALQLRLIASRPAGQAPAQLAIDEMPPLPIDGLGWRRYRVLLPPPLPRNGQVRVIDLHSTTAASASDPRELGVALAWAEVHTVAGAPAQQIPNWRRVLFFVLMGLLIYAFLRRKLTETPALAGAGAAALMLGIGLAMAPIQMDYWMPIMWFPMMLGWVAWAWPWMITRLREQLRGRAASAGFGAAIVTITIAVCIWPLQQPWSNVLGWALLIGGVVQTIAVLPHIQANIRHIPLWPYPGPTLLCITLLALLLRLVGIESIPPGLFRDEARHGLLALQILHDPTFRPVYSDWADLPALLFYLAALPIGIFGPHPWTIRLVPALFGAFTPLALYYALKPIFGPRVSLLAAAFLTVSVWHIGLSRLAFAASLSPMFTLLAVGMLWRALAEGRPKLRLLQAALAGAIAGLALYAYHASRITPLLLAVVVVLTLRLNGAAWRRGIPRLIVLAAAMLLVATPLIGYAMSESSAYTERLGATSVFNPGSLAGNSPLALLNHNIRMVAGMWTRQGDTIARHNLPAAPQLDPLLGLFFIVGGCVALVKWRNPRVQLALVWLAVMSLPGLLSIQTPHAVRMVETIVPTMILAGIGAETLLTWIISSFPRRRLILLHTIGVGVFFGIMLIGSVRYFSVWPTLQDVYVDFYVSDTHIGELVQQLAAQPEIQGHGFQFFIPKNAAGRDIVPYLTDGIKIHTVDGGKLSQQPGDHAILLLSGGTAQADPNLGRQLLSNQGELLGVGPLAPSTQRPEFVIYGRGAEVEQAVQRALESLGPPTSGQ